jgi:hypothetical protein
LGVGIITAFYSLSQDGRGLILFNNIRAQILSPHPSPLPEGEGTTIRERELGLERELQVGRRSYKVEQLGAPTHR